MILKGGVNVTIHGAICFKDNEKLYKIKVFNQDIDLAVSNVVNFYKDNSITELKNFFNKIIWVSDDKDKEIYNKGHLMTKYINCNDIHKVRNAVTKMKKQLAKTDKSYMDRMFEEDVDMSIFEFNPIELNLNFPKVNGELYLKIYNDLELDIDSINYSILFNMDTDELAISNEGNMSEINRENLNEFIEKKANIV